MTRVANPGEIIEELNSICVPVRLLQFCNGSYKMANVTCRTKWNCNSYENAGCYGKYDNRTIYSSYHLQYKKGVLSFLSTRQLLYGVSESAISHHKMGQVDAKSDI